MKFTLDDTGGGNVIQGYAEGQVTINGVIYQHSLILTPGRVIEDWQPDDFSELGVADFTLLAELQPEIVILGTGAVHRFPHPSLSQPLMQQRIGLETMQTAAACRTYNILMGEGRNVAAALFMI
ncbi:MAG: Mth938-like domain-containing protein [Pseudomonadota bacterium]